MSLSHQIRKMKMLKFFHWMQSVVSYIFQLGSKNFWVRFRFCYPFCTILFIDLIYLTYTLKFVLALWGLFILSMSNRWPLANNRLFTAIVKEYWISAISNNKLGWSLFKHNLCLSDIKDDFVDSPIPFESIGKLIITVFYWIYKCSLTCFRLKIDLKCPFGWETSCQFLDNNFTSELI